jgi:transposase
MPAIRTALDTCVIDPALLTSAEQRQHDGWQRRAGENAEILRLARQSVSIKEIVRRTGRSRKLARAVVRGGRTDVFRGRISSLDRFADALEIAWQSGCRNGAALWRLLRTRGFPGGLRVVTEWAARRRNDALASPNGIATDKNAVLAALMHPWSNGQTEGQNTKVKLVKRQMYGRAKLDLLRARLLGVP